MFSSYRSSVVTGVSDVSFGASSILPFRECFSGHYLSSATPVTPELLKLLSKRSLRKWN